LWRLIVRAAVDFFRGAWPFLGAGFLALPAVVELFFLLDDFLLDDFLPDDGLAGCELSCEDEVLWAGNPLPGRSKTPARMVAVKRIRHMGNSV
jgi:hypothetical protein